MQIKISKIHKDAKIPQFAHHDDAGADLFAIEETLVPARGQAIVSTGIAMEIPDGHVGLICGKSGLAAKFGLFKTAGVIDAGYRGEIRVIIVNSTDTDYVFEKGDKVAQILFQKIEHPDIIEATELEESGRGENGFGSTGTK